MIQAPTISEILMEEFMKPYGVSIDKLEADIKIPVRSILKGKHKITVDISLKLGRYFGVSEWYFLNLQNDIDLRNKYIY